MTTETLPVAATPTNPLLAEQIVKTADTCGGKARIAGTRIRVQDVYVWHELQGRSVDQIIASFPQLNHSQVHAALSYFFARPDEIRLQMAEDERRVEELKNHTGPGPLQEKLARIQANGQDHSIPS